MVWGSPLIVAGFGCCRCWWHVWYSPEVFCLLGGVDVVGHGVVFSAQELTVLQAGVASVGPVDDVVCVAP